MRCPARHVFHLGETKIFLEVFREKLEANPRWRPHGDGQSQGSLPAWGWKPPGEGRLEPVHTVAARWAQAFWISFCVHRPDGKVPCETKGLEIHSLILNLCMYPCLHMCIWINREGFSIVPVFSVKGRTVYCTSTVYVHLKALHIHHCLWPLSTTVRCRRCRGGKVRSAWLGQSEVRMGGGYGKG